MGQGKGADRGTHHCRFIRHQETNSKSASRTIVDRKQGERTEEDDYTEDAEDRAAASWKGTGAGKAASGQQGRVSPSSGPRIKQRLTHPEEPIRLDGG